MSIPLKAHSIWLGDEVKYLSNSALEKCRKSWIQHLDKDKWVLKRWGLGDERVKRLTEESPFFREAVTRQNWRVASDYLRLVILYEEGGVYMDTDLMLYQSIDDTRMSSKFFTYIEVDHDNVPIWGLNSRINKDTGKVNSPHHRPITHGMCFGAYFMGAQAGHSFIKKCLDFYDNMNCVIQHSMMTMTYPTTDQMLADIAYDFGFRYIDNMQTLTDGMVIYPSRLCPCTAKYHKEEYEHIYHASHLTDQFWNIQKEPCYTLSNARVLLAIPAFDQVKVNTLESVLRLIKPSDITLDLKFIQAPYGVSMGRNQAASMAVDEGYDYLFFVDSDIILPEDALVKLLNCHADVASGWYYVRYNDGSTPTCLSKFIAPPEGNYYKQIPVEDLDDSQYMEVDAGGMGCMLIKVSLFHTMPYPYFQFVEYHNREVLGEDLFFCNKLRRQDIKVKVDTSLKCGHIKSIVL